MYKQRLCNVRATPFRSFKEKIKLVKKEEDKGRMVQVLDNLVYSEERYYE